MKKQYDLIFSIGGTCSCSQILRDAGLQFTSFPYDWTCRDDLRPKADYLCDGFPGILDPETLFVGDRAGIDRPCWQDSRGFVWPHDLRVGVALEEQLPAVRAKYARRIERLFRLLDSSRRTLVVYIDNAMIPTPTEEDVDYFRQRLAERWPNAGIDMLFIRNVDGVSPKDARITDRPGCRIIDLDCCSYKGVNGSSSINHVVGSYLSGLYEVVDYRTAEEKREGPRKRRLAKYGKFAATNFWDYHWNRFQHKLFRHLQKRLQKKGLV